MAETWETEVESYMVEVGNTQQTVEGEVSAEDVQELARDEGVKKFKVEDAETGDELNQADFPVQNNVRVNEYNENA